jgi:hypothetical protein
VGAEDQAGFGVRVVAVLTAEANLVRSFRGVGRDQDVAAERAVGIVDSLRDRGLSILRVLVGLALNDVALRIVEIVVRKAGTDFVAGAEGRSDRIRSSC